jgi:hypothetical protein
MQTSQSHPRRTTGNDGRSGRENRACPDRQFGPSVTREGSKISFLVGARRGFSLRTDNSQRQNWSVFQRQAENLIQKVTF